MATIYNITMHTQTGTESVHTFQANKIIETTNGPKTPDQIVPGDVFCPNPILGHMIVSEPGVGEENPEAVEV